MIKHLLELQVDKEKLLVKNRECEHREFKRQFDTDSIWKYAKTVVSFANRDGGAIFFGIADKPRALIGHIGDEPEGLVVANFLKEYFEPVVSIELDSIELLGKKILYIRVEPSQNKPVICRKRKIQKADKPGSSDKELLREGAIYYRYNSASEEIKYAELKVLLDDKLQGFFKSLVNNITLINKVGLDKAAIVNAYDFSGDGKTSSIYLTNETAKKINWIKKGKFIENQADGESAYYVTKEVTLSKGVEIEIPVDPAMTYVLTKTGLCEAVGISNNYIMPILEKLNLLTAEHHYLGHHGKNPLHKFTINAKNIILENYPLDMENRMSNIKAVYAKSKAK
ncbi:MAG TPA: ATP-binding protein [Methylophilus sp.]|uniref:AlbA family DNA-binding domain-containing protein n=1 Tax=Methylophilus sp. TaxID=29541 RepID=UPI002C97690C|nr:ATP-binding protein [Methylophilus sp.]HSH85945.1 ATP-binding protein [Methylophilus sp.]